MKEPQDLKNLLMFCTEDTADIYSVILSLPFISKTISIKKSSAFINSSDLHSYFLQEMKIL